MKLASVEISCGRTFTAAELDLVRQTARDFAGLGVPEMVRTICELLHWRQNGHLNERGCRRLLEQLGIIEPRPQPKRSYLTRRDRDCIQGVIDGKNNKQIATDLHLSENTIKVYLSRLYVKLDVTSRLELANWGRSYTESRRIVDEKYHELFPDEPVAKPQFRHLGIAEYTVFRAMAQTIKLTPEQAIPIFLAMAKAIDLTAEQALEISLALRPA